jgi:hypothetical protein
MQLKGLFAAALAFLPLAAPVLAADKREALYDTVLDFNTDGVPDRVALVLVGPGRSDFSEPTKERYSLSADEQIELVLYFGAGAAPLDISKPADIMSRTVVDGERGNWVLPPMATDRGSLQIVTAAGLGSANEIDHTVTIAWRNGAAVVAGYTVSWEYSDSAGTCDVNLLSGKAVLTEGVEDIGQNKKLKGSFKPIPLAKWSAKTRPTVCDDTQ